jgi:hypothetical protein
MVRQRISGIHECLNRFYRFYVPNFMLAVCYFVLAGCDNGRETELYYIPSTGQSNSVGGGGESTALSTSAMYINLLKYNYNGPSLLPLVEPVMSLAAAGQHLMNVETHISAMGNALESALRNEKPHSEKYRTMIFGSHGQGGRDYEWIKKGGGGVSYQNTLDAVAFIKQKMATATKEFNVPGVVLIHGENDAQKKNNRYSNNLMQLQLNYEKDIQQITGQSTPVRLFITQTIGDIDVFGRADANMAVKVSQLQASQGDNKIILVGPTYMIAPGVPTNFHFDNVGYRRLGEYYAKVIKKVVFDGDSWTPLSPNRFTLNKNIITVDFNVPVPPLNFDKDIIIPSAGFEVLDGSKPIDIKSIDIASPTSLKIILSRSPIKDELHIRYGFQRYKDYPNGGGSLIDSDATVSLYENALPNYCVQFRYKLISGKATLY